MYLSGYYIFPEFIYADEAVCIYRGVLYVNQLPVLLKGLKHSSPLSPSIVSLNRLQNEYAITQAIDCPGVLRPIELLQNQDQTVLIFEDDGSVPIVSHPVEWEGLVYSWSQGDRMPIALFWSIALQLTEILAHLETQKIIHQAICLQNIWIQPKGDRITLMNFEHAFWIPKEFPPQQTFGQAITQVKTQVETLAYRSPEQTGRMPFGVDYRTDYYSLGVTFYQLLTGTQVMESHPFVAPDRINAQVPQPLSQLVLKLLALDPEHRYQSAAGLKWDLEYCRSQWSQFGEIQSFDLGTQERRDRFRISDRIYGREAEINTILTSFDRIAHQPEKHLLLVTGASGVGKTVVVDQVQKPIAQVMRGQFIRGKFDQVNRQRPLSAILQAFRDLITRWQSDGDQAIAFWRQKLLDRLGPEVGVLLEVLPELTSIVGPQPPIAVLVGEAQGNRFTRVFLQWVDTLASVEHPLVIFLDDGQWADGASLRLIQQWMMDYQLAHFLCIVAYRDQEVSPQHPLVRTLDLLRDQGILLQELTITPLSPTAINQMVADTLYCAESLASPLGAEIWQRTQGNPFFSIQLFKAFYQDSYLRYLHSESCWQCDFSQIQTVYASIDVIEFMIDRLKRFTAQTRSLISLAACLGNEFDLETLATVAKQSTLTTASQLWRALREGLLIPTSQLYKFGSHLGEDDAEDDAEDDRPLSYPISVSLTESTFGSLFGSVFETVTYRFLHDRVQQAAYSLIAPSHRAITHLRIGQCLQEKLRSSLTNGTISDKQLFDLMSHLNQGIPALLDPSGQTELAELNRMAGTRAADATAYQAAFEYAQIGLSLLPIDRWQTHGNLTRSLYELAAEMAYLSGEFNQTPAFITVLQQNSRSVLEWVRACEIQIRAYGAEGKPLAAVELALVALEKLGVPLTHRPNLIQIAIDLVKLRWIFLVRSPDYFLNLPTMTDEKAITIARVIHNVSYLIILSSPKLLPHLVFHSVQLSLKSGNSIYSIYSYLGTGILLTSIWKHLTLGYQVGQIAIKLLDRDEDKEFESLVRTGLGVFINHWKVPLREIASSVQPCYEKSLELGDFDRAAWAFHTYTYHQCYAGWDLRILAQDLKETIPQIKQFNQVGALRFIQITQAAISTLRGISFFNPEQSDDWDLLDVLLQSAQAVNSRTELFVIHYNQGMLQYLFGKYTEAYESFHNASMYRDAAITIVVNALHHFYLALTLTAYQPLQPKLQQIRLHQTIRSSLQFLDRGMKHCPENYANKYYLVKAEYARIKRDRLTAMDAYEKSIAFAAQNQLIHELALAYELTARFYAQWNQISIAQMYMKQAYDAYEIWGAMAKLEHLKRTYPYLLATIE